MSKLCKLFAAARCLFGHKWEELGPRTSWVYTRAKRHGGPIPCGVYDVMFECARCGSAKEPAYTTASAPSVGSTARKRAINPAVCVVRPGRTHRRYRRP